MITYLENEKQFQLDTPHASYVLAIADEGYLCHVYWGERIAPQDLTDLLRLQEGPFVPSKNNRERASFLDSAPFEYPTAGTGDYRDARAGRHGIPRTAGSAVRAAHRRRY